MGYLGTRAPKPMLIRTFDEMLLVKDIQCASIDSTGDLVRSRSIGWASAPDHVGYTYPYLIVVLRNRVEIRNAKSGALLQVVDIASIQNLNDGKSLFMATSSKVFRLIACPYIDQVEQLIHTKQLHEALSLLESLDSVLLDNKVGQIRRAKELLARDHFVEGDYDGSMDLFGESWTVPSEVVALLPELKEPVLEDDRENQEAAAPDEDHAGSDSPPASVDLPGSTHGAGKVTETLAPVTPSDRASSNAAFRSVSTFLARSRRLLMRFLSSPRAPEEEQYFTSWPSCRPLTPAEMECELGIADTALLKIYIATSPGLVGSLVRLANRCDPRVVKDYLVKEDRWRELVDFYYSKGLHEEALGLLKQKDAVSVAIQYLQRLDAKDWSVITRYSPWLLNASPEKTNTVPIPSENANNESATEEPNVYHQTLAIDIFTETSRESDTFDRATVATFLASVDVKFGIQYLSFIIHTWKDTTPHFSEDLIQLYVESGRVEELITFIESEENSANAARIYNHIPQTTLFNEVRALVLAMMGNLTKALEIYVRKIGNPQKSEIFALKQYQDNPKTFEILLQLYLTPATDGTSQELHVDEALDLLKRHGPRLDADQVLSSLPPHTSLAAIRDYLQGRLRENLLLQYSGRIESKLREAALLRAQIDLSALRQKFWMVGVDRVCAVCHKRLGNSVLAVFPDGGCAHYGCQRRYTGIQT